MAGNLGNYERIIHWSHLAKGPSNLLLGVAVFGFVTIRAVEYGASKAFEKHRKRKEPTNIKVEEEAEPITSS